MRCLNSNGGSNALECLILFEYEILGLVILWDSLRNFSRIKGWKLLKFTCVTHLDDIITSVLDSVENKIKKLLKRILLGLSTSCWIQLHTRNGCFNLTKVRDGCNLYFIICIVYKRYQIQKKFDRAQQLKRSATYSHADWKSSASSIRPSSFVTHCLAAKVSHLVQIDNQIEYMMVGKRK